VCAPYVHPQRIIFILIHLPLPLSYLPALSLFSSPIPHLVHRLLFVRHLVSRTLAPNARTVSSVIRSPIHTRQARARCEEAREREREREGGGLESQEKKRRIYLLPSRWDHLSFWCRAVSDSLIARPCVWSTLLGSCGENEECRKWMRSARMISLILLRIYLGNVKIEVNICLPEHTRKLISLIEKISRCL